MKLLQLPEGKIEIAMPVGEIDAEGRALILHFLEKSCPRLTAWDLQIAFPKQSSEKGWQWRWQVAKGGNLTKRIASSLYKNFTIKLTTEQMAELGVIAKKHTVKTKKFVVDFNNALNWKAGEFGDYGSCFMSKKHSAQEFIIDVGGYAARFWTPDKKKGIGRLWMLPYPVPVNQDDYVQTGWVALNGYFNSDEYASESPSGQKYGALQTSDLTKVVAQILGFSYKKAGHFAMRTEILYANGSGNSTFVVSDVETLSKHGEKDEIAYNVDPRIIASHYLTCARCGAIKSEYRPLKLDLEKLGWVFVPDVGHVCRTCSPFYIEQTCFACGKKIRPGTISYRVPVAIGKIEHVCAACDKTHKVFTCLKCDFVKIRDDEQLPDGWCKECYAKEKAKHQKKIEFEIIRDDDNDN